MENKAKKSKLEKTSEAAKGGFFQNLFGSLFSSANPEAEKKRKLKAVAKSFSKSKYHTFYKPASIEILPPFAKFLYDIYKVISQSQLLFRSDDNINYAKRQIINYSLSQNQLDILERLDEQHILEATKKVPIAKLTPQVEKDLSDFSNEFDDAKITRIENLLKAYTLFKDFCTFDYYVLLKKFYAALQENSFNITPNFEKINAEYGVDNIKDFCSVAYAITDETVAWSDLFEFLQSTRSGEIMSAGTWKKVVARIRSLQTSKSLELMIRHITSNFDYKVECSYQNVSIVEPYLDKLQEETRATIAKIGTQQKEDKANQISQQIFGSTEFKSLTNYVNSANGIFEKKGLAVYEYTEPLNALKTFLLEYVKRDLREFFDIVVIRGQWASALAAPMSNAYQELLKISDEITTFDDTLAEDGTNGVKIKTHLPKTAHDRGAETIVNRIIEDANDSAKNFILTATQDFVSIGKTMKELIEDYMKSKPVLVSNWKELEKYIETPLKDFSVNIYKKIYLFVQLMQAYLK